MTNRRAFTLLELVVSIAVAGIIALLAYGSAAAGFDTRDALARHKATAESELRVRAMITDALRHASDEADSGRVALEVQDATDPQGLPADRLTFLTRGVLPPLGASSLWTMTIEPSASGLVLYATPVGGASDAAITAPLPHARGMDVEVMSLTSHTWAAEWPSKSQLPAAVQITLFDGTGGAIGAPLVVRLGLEAVR